MTGHALTGDLGNVLAAALLLGYLVLGYALHRRAVARRQARRAMLRDLARRRRELERRGRPGTRDVLAELHLEDLARGRRLDP